MKEKWHRWLNSQRGWLEFQEMNREGWRAAWQRRRMQRRILRTPPIHTATTGPVEIRVLTCRRDWLNALWALKSFYFFSEADYPLYVHDGGLDPGQPEQIRRHFPGAIFISRPDADATVESVFARNGWERALAYRRHHETTRKLFDFYALSRADYVISIDPDIVFFRKPDELIAGIGIPRKNLYNRDCGYWYSLSLDELEAQFGIRPTAYVNSGLALVRRESMDFHLMNRCLHHPTLFEDTWVSEQTLHALCSSVYGVELLPDTYMVSANAGMLPNTVAKHYPGFFRPLLYSEGMAALLESRKLPGLSTIRPGATTSLEVSPQV